MGKSIALLFVLIFLVASCVMVAKPVSAASATGNSWVEKAPMQVARADAGVAVVNGNIYAIGGNTVNGTDLIDQVYIQGNVLNTVEKYDPSTDNWTSKAPMPTPRDSFAIAVYQNKIYCIGGRTGFPKYSPQTFTSVNQVYDTGTDKWYTKAPMPTVEWPLQANVVNGKIYVIGYSGVTYAYDPVTDSWATKSKAPTVNNTPAGFATAVYDNKIYVIGISDSNLIFDPLNDTWSKVNSSQPYKFEGLMLYGYFRPVAAATSGMLSAERIYLFFKNQVHIYDPSNDTWSLGSNLLSDRVDYGVGVVNDTFYVVGGFNNPTNVVGFSAFGPVATNEQYFPIGYGTPDPTYVLEHTPPKISVLSPLNQTYGNSSVPLVFTINKAVNWTAYNLDEGKNATIAGNCSITDILNGVHSITVYANDTYGNMGASETLTFTIAKPEPFPTTLAATASGLSVAVVGLGLLVYFKKRRH
jgi:N-acetylneuraminic acid mutarotase